MLSKCANPSCSAQLVYLREGKIFTMESTASHQSRLAVTSGQSKVSRRVEHFWLCGTCAEHWTLAFDDALGLQVIPKKTPMDRRAS